jgi:hypothetical protein
MADMRYLKGLVDSAASQMRNISKHLDTEVTMAVPLSTTSRALTVSISLLMRLYKRIQEEELAGHFTHSLISNIEHFLNENPRKPSSGDDVDGPDGQPTLENITAVCEHGPGRIPGICFPIDHHGTESTCESDDGMVFISRDDQAGMFASDVDAANFVACLIGKPWKKHFDQPPAKYFYPYFELTLAEVSLIHAMYGTDARRKW